MNLLYNPQKSYEENFAEPPFKTDFQNKNTFQNQNTETTADFLGIKLNSDFGIPAGPLLNSKYCQEAFNRSYDVCVYKTVRSQFRKCNDFPNVLYAHPQNKNHLTLEEANSGVLADAVIPSNLTEISISNSFGVPSQKPSFWIEDVKKAVQFANEGQLLILSFQPTGQNTNELIEDIREVSKLALETGVKVFEINTSCPNEGKDALLCYDLETTVEVLKNARSVLGEDAKIIIKTAYFEDDNYLESFINKTHKYIDAYSTINTISTHLYDANGNNALGLDRPTSGVCGASIKWAGLDAVKKFKQYRDKAGLDFQIVGVGGVMKPNDYSEYKKAGADLVMSATGAMFIEDLATQIKNSQIT